MGSVCQCLFQYCCTSQSNADDDDNDDDDDDHEFNVDNNGRAIITTTDQTQQHRRVSYSSVSERTRSIEGQDWIHQQHNSRSRTIGEPSSGTIATTTASTTTAVTDDNEEDDATTAAGNTNCCRPSSSSSSTTTTTTTSLNNHSNNESLFNVIRRRLNRWNSSNQYDALIMTQHNDDDDNDALYRNHFAASSNHTTTTMTHHNACDTKGMTTSSPLREARTFNTSNDSNMPCTINADEFVLPGSMVQQQMAQQMLSLRAGRSCPNNNGLVLLQSGHVNNDDYNIEECVICMEPFDISNPRMPTLCSCGTNKTYFHLPCLYQWIEQSENCPTCRSKITWDEF
jgi:Ring finger domain